MYLFITSVSDNKIKSLKRYLVELVKIFLINYMLVNILSFKAISFQGR